MTKNELLDNLNIKILSIRKKGKITIINDQYVIKSMNRKSDFYDYLYTRKFNYFPKIYSKIDDEVELMDYIIEKNIPLEQKLEDLVYLTSILHLDTFFDKVQDLDYIKEIYENIVYRLDEVNNYYHSLQDLIEEEIYMSPSNYLLIRNISDIYKSISLSRNYIEKWYQSVKNNKSIRYSYIHGNLRLEHLLESDNKYLISWDNSRLDFPVIDLDILYRNSFLDININDILKIYNTKFKLKKEEEYLLFSLLLIPDKIYSDLEYDKIKEVSRIVLYNDSIYNTLKNYSNESNNDTNK